MKVLLFGSGGFIGRNVSDAMREAGHEVIDTYRDAGERPGYSVDLLDPAAVEDVLEKAQPDVVVNCAGIVQNNEAAKANPVYTGNIIAGILANHLRLKRMVVLGSAAEYGVVEPDEVPVHEDTPQRAANDYGRSKVEEVNLALKHREESDLPIVVARVFNPLGTGMPERQLVPRLLGQIKEIKSGNRQAIEVSRTDADRDYIEVKDLARAIVRIATGDSVDSPVYNVGSGKKTSNGELIELLVRESDLPADTPVVETSDQPEPHFAAQADIGRLKALDWRPETPLGQTMKEIVDDAK